MPWASIDKKGRIPRQDAPQYFLHLAGDLDLTDGEEVLLYVLEGIAPGEGLARPDQSGPVHETLHYILVYDLFVDQGIGIDEAGLHPFFGTQGKFPKNNIRTVVDKLFLPGPDS